MFRPIYWSVTYILSVLVYSLARFFQLALLRIVFSSLVHHRLRAIGAVPIKNKKIKIKFIQSKPYPQKSTCALAGTIYLKFEDKGYMNNTQLKIKTTI
jgi:hypothetical protein